VVPVCAPPLLLIVTSDPTWVDEDVVPDVVAVSVVAVVPVPVDVAPPLVDVASLPAGPLDDSPAEVVLDVEPAELVEDGSGDVPVVSAPANP
jgi:hypothetical protein